MARIVVILKGLGRSHRASVWIEEINAAFISGSLLAGTLRLGVVCFLQVVRTTSPTGLAIGERDG